MQPPPESVEKILKDAEPDASPASWAVRFAANLEGVITVLSGMSNVEQMQDNLSYMKTFDGLSEKEKETLDKAQEELKKIPLIPCTTCNYCAKVCPQNLIKIHDCANYIVVKCSNKEKGAVARKQCEVSCIGCGICEKTCTAGAIHVEDNCAVIQEDICLSCGMCSVKCPRHVIHDLRGVFTAVR